MAVKKKTKPKSVAKAAQVERNMVPLYVLIIMVLATAVVMMMNRSQDMKSVPVKSPVEKNNVKPADTAATSPEKREADSNEKKPDTDESVKEASKKIKIYFLTYNDRTGKITPGAVVREIKGENDVLQALNTLAKGLSSSEEKRGLISAMPEEMTFRGVVVRNGIAEIDCSQTFMENAQGDILTGRLNQIFLTATQFPGVSGIMVKINGKPVKSLGGDGLMVSWPMRKMM